MKDFPRNPVDYYQTFSSFVEGISRKFADRPAVSYFTRRQEERCYSFQELGRQVNALRESLYEMGIAGAHVALVGENSYDWLLSYLAITSSGGVAVCVDAEQADEIIRQLVRQADAVAVFASGAYLPICRQMEEIKHFVALGEETTDDGMESVQQLCRKGELLLQKGKSTPPAEIQPRQTAVIAYTSGTTSQSKAVMLSHEAILQNASDSSVYVSAEQNVFSSLPFYHTYGMTCAVLATLVRGAHLYFNGDLKTAMRDLHLSKPDSMLTVPLMIEAIHNQIWLNAEKAGKADALHKLLKLEALRRKLGLKSSKAITELREKSVGSLHIIICGGAHLSLEIAEEFQLLGILTLQGYGITECSPLVSVNSNHSYQLDSVGHVLPGCEVKIEEEEIWVRGKSVMNGYYKSPEQTREVMEGEWFKTGDLGYQDKDGFLYITGRKKNLVVFKNGKKVSPEKLEEMIKGIPMVKDVLVYGATSGASADDVKLAASIYPDPARSQGMSPYEILEHLQGEINQINASLPLYQQVQMVNIREEEFVKTASQKIKRHMV